MDSNKLFSHASIVFTVEDVQKSAEYYRDKLGFDITFTWEEPASYAVVNRDDAVGVHFTQKEEGMEKDLSQTNSPSKHTSLFIFVHDVDQVFEEYLEKGVDIIQAPTDRVYGMRDFDIRDINGYVLTIGTSLERINK